MGIQRVDDERGSAALADLLNGNARSRPVVVVTIPAGRTEPWIDTDAIAREAGDLADVYLMPTSDVSWVFSHRMAEGTQVYGGAGRVYPVGHEWASDLSRSPLRFAFNVDDGQRATQKLISDALRMAVASGLLQSLPARLLRHVEGVVKGVVAGRALVDIGNVMPAAIAEELTVEDLPIERLTSVGQPIEGLYNAETNRLDVTANLRPASDALAAYSAGDVVLAKVAAVEMDKAELLLYPKTTTPAVTVTVDLADVTTNPYDDLRLLMTVGEVASARVAVAGPSWALVLNDVADDEPVRTAPSLLPAGPPWLIQEPDEPDLDERGASAPAWLPLPAPAGVRRAEEPTAVETTPATPRPNPAMLSRNQARPGPSLGVPVPTPARQSEGTRALLLKIDGLSAEVNRLAHEQNDLLGQFRAASDEREQLRYLMHQAERRANRAEHDLKAAKARLRKAGTTKSLPEPGEAPGFADPNEGFRYLVLTQWATRTPPSEQAARPLPDYVIGPDFLDSLARLEGIKHEKVADVVFEIVTGRASEIPGREVHRLRTGPAGEDPIRVRDDGAVAWRSSLQVKTASARRIHYWRLPNGRFELARVVTHDDFDI